MTKSKFTINKQVVRALQAETILSYFTEKIGNLRYFGLPSEEMKDILDWDHLFSEFVVVERGCIPNNWEIQHKLLVTAFKNEIISKTFLLRGDIDNIILNGGDEYGNTLKYPFDVVSLDYSGGLLCRDKNQEQPRLEAILKLIENQSELKHNFLLLISTNLDNWKDREIKHTLEHIRTELLRMSTNGDDVIEAYLKHEKDEVRIKIYLPFLINHEATHHHYNCETKEAVFYRGNQNTHMMNFRFYLKYDKRTTSSRFPKERLFDIFNRSMVEIKSGKQSKADISSLNLPKLCPKK